MYYDYLGFLLNYRLLGLIPAFSTNSTGVSDTGGFQSTLCETFSCSVSSLTCSLHIGAFHSSVSFPPQNDNVTLFQQLLNWFPLTHHAHDFQRELLKIPVSSHHCFAYKLPWLNIALRIKWKLISMIHKTLDSACISSFTSASDHFLKKIIFLSLLILTKLTSAVGFSDKIKDAKLSWNFQ